MQTASSRWIAILAGMLLAVGAPGVGRAQSVLADLPEPVYERTGDRDPLTPPGWAPPRVEEPAREPEAPEAPPRRPIELRLTGIIRSGNDRLAILNGRILAAGERAILREDQSRRQIKVVEVGDHEVVVQGAGGETIRLRLDRSNGEGAD